MEKHRGTGIERRTAAKNGATKTDTRASAAPVDIYENAEEILILADFPGVIADALTVHLEGTELSFEGRQRSGAVLRRSFQVPSTVDSQSVAAKLESGVLEVRLPKRSDAKPRRIEVKGS